MIKVKDRKLLLLAGDGIGPEVVREVKKIIEWFNKNKSSDFKIEEGLVGGASYDKHKTPITDEVFYKALESEAVILGAVGGPKYDNLEFSKRPERALLKLRKELKLFANLRPAICFKQLVEASSLKAEIISGLDIMIVRELTGGIYFGEPRGIEPIENNERKGINTHTYTTSEIQRVARVAFDLAKKRNNKVTSCEKSNVMEAGQLWKEEIQTLHDKDFKDVNAKRWVMFKDEIEASNIPPHWHAWLHKSIKDPPVNYSHKYKWQKDHEPNKTGTSEAYFPSSHH